jgi:putative hydrolase of the HAD superfamily
MNKNTNINWSIIKVVIFDVDGTLYSQSKLRKKMMFSIFFYYLLRPWRVEELLMLYNFRVERERMTSDQIDDLENEQYVWCATKKKYSVRKLKDVIGKWIFEFPNRYLNSCIYPGTMDFFEALKSYGIKIAIYSDYKALEKIRSMNLWADLVVSSTDPEVNSFKPNPIGLLYIARKIGVGVQECLFIGDRDEKDGMCALNANMPYLIVGKQPFVSFAFYKDLRHLLFKFYKANLV